MKKLKNENYSLSAGQYFEIKFEYINISEKEFNDKISSYYTELDILFQKNIKLTEKPFANIKDLYYAKV